MKYLNMNKNLKNNTLHCSNKKMRFSILFFLFTLIIVLNADAQFGILSPDTKVSLVTVGPGNELYSGFGHSVIWISDPRQGVDRAYNYGTFSFETGNFYIKFLRGTLPYSLSVGPLFQQTDYWKAENRSIKEEVLNLSAPQKQKLYNFLENNALPENRLYQYKFFFDNCSTRMATALKAACGDSLSFPGYTHEKLSFRQWIDRYAYKQNPWADFGMDLAIGSPSDEIATAEQATFLPDNLSIAFRDSKVKIGNQTLPLIASTHDIFVAQPVVNTEWLTPMLLFWTLAGVVLLFTLWQIKYENINFTLDKIIFSFVGVIGWFILLLWFGTNHGVTAFNYDILWAFPLWLPLILYISPVKKPSWFQYLLIFYGFLLLCATGNLLKHNYVVLPILLILVIRVYYMNNSLSKIPQKG